MFHVEQINSGSGEPHLLRRVFFKSNWISLYLHHFIGDDRSRDLHDHPKWFLSIGLWGSYTEETREGLRHFRAPWIRWFRATHTHRILASDAWTLVITGPVVRPWGFYSPDGWIEWRAYVKARGLEARRLTRDEPA